MTSRLHPEMITTGQAADLLGVTIQHVINLCARGQLPYTLTGTHRRLLLEDVLRLKERVSDNHGGPLTRDQIRSLWLHRAAAAHIARDPVNSLTQARSEIERILEMHLDGEPWLRQWLPIIEQGPEEVMRAMCSIDPLARELRQNSPFLTLLSEEERLSIIQAAFSNQTPLTENISLESIKR